MISTNHQDAIKSLRIAPRVRLLLEKNVYHFSWFQECGGVEHLIWHTGNLQLQVGP